MSTVRPLIDGWLGYGDGATVLLETGTPIDAAHPAVAERPELFEAVAPAPAPAKKVAAKKPPADG